MNNFRIQEFLPDEASNVQNLLKAIFQDLGYRFDLSQKDSDLKDIEKIYFANKGKFWMLYDDENFIGTIAIRYSENQYYELKRFFIHKSARGRGFGNLALEHALRYAKENQMQSLKLDVDVNSQSAIHLYSKFGFKEISAYKNADNSNLKWFEKIL